MTLELMCLGTGMGKSNAYEAIPSSSFALLKDGTPWLMVDCGNGVLRSALRHLGMIPKTMFITHNHADHTGDLPYAVRATPGKTRLLGHPTVLEWVRDIRFHDAPAARQAMIEAVEWLPADDLVLTLDEGWSFELRQSQHSYLCFGFVLSFQSEPVLAYGADSGFDEQYYQWLSRAPWIIVDGRPEPLAEHASFSQIESFAARYPSCQFRIVHHGAHDHHFQSPNVHLWREGDRERID